MENDGNIKLKLITNETVSSTMVSHPIDRPPQMFHHHDTDQQRGQILGGALGAEGAALLHALLLLLQSVEFLGAADSLLAKWPSKMLFVRWWKMCRFEGETQWFVLICVLDTIPRLD